MDIDVLKLNASTLIGIREQIDQLASKVDEMIFYNDRAVADAVFISRARIEPISSGDKRIPIARQVRRLLQLSRGNGITVEEIVCLLSKKQSIVPQTVRCALRRSRADGTAKSIGRRWYAIAGN